MLVTLLRLKKLKISLIALHIIIDFDENLTLPFYL